MAIEFGNYPQAGALIKRLPKSSQAEAQPFVEKLKAVCDEVDVSRDRRREVGGRTGGKILDRLCHLSGSFRRNTPAYDIPSDVTDSLKILSDNPEIKTGKQAQRDLFQAKRSLAKSTSLPARKHGITMLEKVVKESPDTEMATEARALLQEAQPSTDAHPATDAKSGSKSANS